MYDLSFNCNQLKYWVALQGVFQYRPCVAVEIVKTYEDLTEFFSFSKDTLIRELGMEDKHVSLMKSDSYLKECEEEIKWALKKGIKIITYNSDYYPLLLKEINDSPIILFCFGNESLFNNRNSVSIVGTRLSTGYGNEMCRSICDYLSSTEFNPVIYSGLAFGIDSHIHKEAIKNKLQTVAILPNGLDMIYPALHRDLAKDIIKEGGALITEYRKGIKPIRPNFLKRNRIIAGISDGMIIVESRIKGGSMITVEYAGMYAKEIMAVPGRITDINSFGCNYLISKNVAHILNSPLKISAILGWDRNAIINEISEQNELFNSNPIEKQEILSILCKQKPLFIDYICTKTELKFEDVSIALTDLELEGKIISKDGGFIKN